MASSQDDLIDTYDRAGETDKKKIAKELREVIFGPDRVFYRAAFTVVANELKELDLQPEVKKYLRQKFSGWYRLHDTPNFRKQFKEHETELVRVRTYLLEHRVGKCTPKLFKELAPQSYALVEEQYKSYGEELKRDGVAGRLLNSVGNTMFELFPKVRGVMYRINPDYSNF